MKRPIYLIGTYLVICAASLVFSTSAVRADEKGHKHGDKTHTHKKRTPGPNGGRLITSVKPSLEFLVTKDRKIRITAVDEKNQAVAIGEQSIKVTGGSRFLPTRLKFEKDGKSLLSTKAFPEGKNPPVVVQIKVSPDAKTVTEKFYLNMSKCPECKLDEYACICGHAPHEHK